jgi:hypothetical protein
VLLDPVLDDLGGVAHRAQVGVDPLDHVLTTMAELARDRVETHRCPVVERLESRRRVRMAEQAMTDLARFLAEGGFLGGVSQVEGLRGCNHMPPTVPFDDPVLPIRMLQRRARPEPVSRLQRSEHRQTGTCATRLDASGLPIAADRPK